MQLNIGWKYVLFFVVLLLDEALMEDYEQEEHCSRTGGICIPKEECPHKIPKNQIGLCPKQQKEGIECCHQVSNAEHRCRKLGGECQPKKCSHDFLQVRRAKDCAEDEVCCVLLRYNDS